MRVLTSKDADLSSYFDKVNDKINKEILLNKHTIQANKGKVFGQLALEHIFGFSNTFIKNRKLRF